MWILLISGWWRDVLALSWDFHTYHSADVIKEMIYQKNTDAIGLSNFHIDSSQAVKQTILAPALGHCIIAYFLFETKVGRGRGIVILTSADETGRKWKAFTCYTSLQELKGYEEKKGSTRPNGVESGDSKTWLEKRSQMENMDGIEPTVLVIGSGQSGLNVAARLGMLDIPTLIIEKNERVGDNWRNRYKTYFQTLDFTDHRLVIHDPVRYVHLAHLPFPDHWPVFSSKGDPSSIRLTFR